MEFTMTQKRAKEIVDGKVNYKLTNVGLNYTDDYTAGFAAGFLHGTTLAEPLLAALKTLAFDCKHAKTKEAANKVISYWRTVLDDEQ